MNSLNRASVRAGLHLPSLDCEQNSLRENHNVPEDDEVVRRSDRFKSPARSRRTWHSRRTLVLLGVIAVGSGALVVRSGQSTANAPQPVDSTVQTRDSKSGPASLPGSDPDLSAASNDDPGTQELFFKMMFMVLLVGAMGAAAIYFSRRFLPRITNMPGKRIKVIETAYLGPRKAVHLLRIDNQVVLVGSTNEQITKLAEIDSSITGSPAQCEVSG